MIDNSELRDFLDFSPSPLFAPPRTYTRVQKSVPGGYQFGSSLLLPQWKLMHAIMLGIPSFSGLMPLLPSFDFLMH